MRVRGWLRITRRLLLLEYVRICPTKCLNAKTPVACSVYVSCVCRLVGFSPWRPFMCSMSYYPIVFLRFLFSHSYRAIHKRTCSSHRKALSQASKYHDLMEERIVKDQHNDRIPLAGHAKLRKFLSCILMLLMMPTDMTIASEREDLDTTLYGLACRVRTTLCINFYLTFIPLCATIPFLIPWPTRTSVEQSK